MVGIDSETSLVQVCKHYFGTGSEATTTVGVDMKRLYV